MTYIGQLGQAFGDAVQGQLEVGIAPNHRVVGSHGDHWGRKFTRTFARQGLDVTLVVVAALPIRNGVHGDLEVPALRQLAKLTLVVSDIVFK